MSIYEASKTPANNASGVTNVNFAEGQTPGSVNDSQRQWIAYIAEFRDDITGTLTNAGTTSALTVTTNSGIGSNTDGRIVVFRSTLDAVTGATLAVDGEAAKKIRVYGDLALRTDDITVDGVYAVVYSSAGNSGAGAWMLLNPNPANMPFDVDLTADTTETRVLQVGVGRSGDGNSQIDLVGDATYTDYGLRVARVAGANGKSRLLHRGTGLFEINTEDGGDIAFYTNNALALTIPTNGQAVFEAPTNFKANVSTNTFDLALNSGSGFRAQAVGHVQAQRPTSVGSSSKCFSAYYGTSQNFYVQADGAVYGNGTYGTISDRKRKREIRNAPTALAEIRTVQTRTYERVEKPGVREEGLVAQELAAIPRFASLVTEDPDTLDQVVNTYGLIVPLLKSVQELADQVDALTARVTALEGA